MPIFSYECKCGNKFTELAKAGEVVKCPACGEDNTPKLPTGTASSTFETKDPYRGKQIRKGVTKELQHRMRQHHDKYELAEKIDKYGMKEAERHGWTKKIKKV